MNYSLKYSLREYFNNLTHNSQLTTHNSHINLILLYQPKSIAMDIHDLEIVVLTEVLAELGYEDIH